jgi:hypothetical protein
VSAVQLPRRLWAVVDPRDVEECASRALVVYPGPVGELVARELLAALNFGYLGPGGLTERLMASITDAELGP